MKKTVIFLLMVIPFLFVSFHTIGSTIGKKNEMSWWYNKPAEKYWEGLPIGTGRFAAMIGGSVQHENIYFKMIILKIPHKIHC